MFKTLKPAFSLMRFSVQSKAHPNTPKYPSGDFSLAKKFGEAMQRELGAFLKAAVLFGSAARGEPAKYSEPFS